MTKSQRVSRVRCPSCGRCVGWPVKQRVAISRAERAVIRAAEVWSSAYEREDTAGARAMHTRIGLHRAVNGLIRARAAAKARKK